MAKYFIEDTTLKNMADTIRSLTGTTSALTPGQMTTEVQIADENIEDTLEALEALGVEIPEGSDIGDLADLVGNVEIGTDTSDATAASSDILSGKTAYANGEKITGTIATKTSNDLTTSGATVTVPAGYYASNASKSVGTATQATPSVTVSSGGLITATATQSAGYVNAGSKSGTKQLTTQAAKTVTPSTSNQTAVASGSYTTGAITVKGDSNLRASNIKNGVSIFGVYGTLEEGIDTSDATATADEIFSGEIAYVNGNKVTGTFTIQDELTEQNDLISQIATLVNQKATNNESGNLEWINVLACSDKGTGIVTPGATRYSIPVELRNPFYFILEVDGCDTIIDSYTISGNSNIASNMTTIRNPSSTSIQGRDAISSISSATSGYIHVELMTMMSNITSARALIIYVV